MFQTSAGLAPAAPTQKAWKPATLKVHSWAMKHVARLPGEPIPVANKRAWRVAGDRLVPALYQPEVKNELLAVLTTPASGLKERKSWASR